MDFCNLGEKNVINRRQNIFNSERQNKRYCRRRHKDFGKESGSVCGKENNTRKTRDLRRRKNP